jgi:16S rRNA (guanine966-N2)-methyltransferase
VRLTGGEARGRRLKAPRGRLIRPTSDRVRKALFDILGRRIEGADFLDVYAGTGAVGCEALSRGARRVVFLEREPQALSLIEHNLKIGTWTGLGEVVPGEARVSLRELGRRGRRFDIVFLDPPYDQPVGTEDLQRVADLIEPGGAIVVEHRATERIAAPAMESHPLRTYRHGDSALSVWRIPEALRRA